MRGGEGGPREAVPSSPAPLSLRSESESESESDAPPPAPTRRLRSTTPSRPSHLRRLCTTLAASAAMLP